MSKPKFVDAFAGAGGMSLGLERAGFEMAFAFDLDEHSVRTLQANTRYPERVMRADINELLRGSYLESQALCDGDVELVVGGPPCQGFSVQRIGSDQDARNELVISFADLVLRIAPRFFVMENVPSITGRRGRSTLDEALGRLSSAGYLMDSQVLNAENFGVPQRRRRRFVLGEKTDAPFMSVRLPQGTGARKTVRMTIGNLPPPPADGSAHHDLPQHRRDRLSTKNLERLAALGEGQGRTDLPENLLAECHRRDADEIGHRNVYGRMSWDKPAPTITARFDSFTRGMFGHPDQPRTISLYEGALLQSFPESYQFVGNKVDVARQIGNAVPPMVAEAIGRAILEGFRA